MLIKNTATTITIKTMITTATAIAVTILNKTTNTITLTAHNCVVTAKDSATTITHNYRCCYHYTYF